MPCWLLPACKQKYVDLVRGGKTKSVIILQDDTRENRTAANILQLFVGRISGADIPVVSNRKVKKGDILIGGQVLPE